MRTERHVEAPMISSGVLCGLGVTAMHDLRVGMMGHPIREMAQEIKTQAAEVASDFSDFFGEMTGSQETVQKKQQEAREYAELKKQKGIKGLYGDGPPCEYTQNFLSGYVQTRRHGEAQLSERQLPMMPHLIVQNDGHTGPHM